MKRKTEKREKKVVPVQNKCGGENDRSMTVMAESVKRQVLKEAVWSLEDAPVTDDGAEEATHGVLNVCITLRIDEELSHGKADLQYV